MPTPLASNGGTEFLDALRNLIQSLVNIFGTWGTIGIIVGLVVISGGWKIYNIWRKDKEVNLALQEKDRTIQRLAEQERNLRVLFFKEKCGWTDEQVDRFIMKNEFPDVPSARKELEGEQQTPKPEAKKRRGKKDVK
jgi:hypothetical protein